MPAGPIQPVMGRAVIREVAKNRPLLGSWLATGGGCFGLGIFITHLPLHAYEQGLTYGQIGLVFAVQGVMNAVSRLPFGHLSDRVKRRSLLVIWGLVGMLAGLVAAIQLALPAMDLDLPWFTFGRLRPLHTTTSIYAHVATDLLSEVIGPLEEMPPKS